MGVFWILVGRVVFEASCFRIWWCWVPSVHVYFYFLDRNIFFTRDSIVRRCLKFFESYFSSSINCFFLLRSLILLCRWFLYLPLCLLVSLLLVSWILVLSLFVLLVSFLLVLCLFTKFFDLLFFVVSDLLMFLCRLGLVGIIIFFGGVWYFVFLYMCVCRWY